MSDIRWVRITSVPAGEAPLWVRQEWIGIELPDLGLQTCSRGYGIITGRPDPDPGEHFVISVQVAVDALARKNPTAANWFRQHISMQNEFGFRRSEVTNIPYSSPPPSGTDIQEIK